MKMGDGGFRPAYNVQLAVAGSPEGGPRTVVGIRVHNIGSDMSSLGPMLDDIEQRTGQLPETLLADGNHVTLDDIAHAESRGVQFIAPIPQRMRDSAVQHTGAVGRWLGDMVSEEARRQLRGRASLCELVNAHFKARFGLDRLLVRGAAKVTCVILLASLAFNILQHGKRLLA
jgi:hypothetical protein